MQRCSFQPTLAPARAPEHDLEIIDSLNEVDVALLGKTTRVERERRSLERVWDQTGRIRVLPAPSTSQATTQILRFLLARSSADTAPKHPP